MSTITAEGQARIGARGHYHAGADARDLVIKLIEGGMTSSREISAAMPPELRISDRAVRAVRTAINRSTWEPAPPLTTEARRQVEALLRHGARPKVITDLTGANRNQIRWIRDRLPEDAMSSTGAMWVWARVLDEGLAVGSQTAAEAAVIAGGDGGARSQNALSASEGR